MTARGLAACVAVVLACRLAGADAPVDDRYFHQLATAIRAQLDAAAAAHAPKLVPPVPIEVKWRAARIVGSIDLGSVVAITAADLDGDRKAELYAVTTREVIAIAVGGGHARELGRVAFPAELAAPASRDPIGTIVADGDGIVAAVSTRAKGLRVHWRGPRLVGEAIDASFATCAGDRAERATGRNFFVGNFYAKRCRDDLVGPQGRPLRVRGTVTTADKLDVTIETCDGRAGCTRTARYELANVGVAFELADVDRDGRPEAIVSGAGAPGDADFVRVIALGDDDRKPLYKHEWHGGVVGIVAADVDGDGRACVIVAVRLAGASRVDLWRIN